MKVSDWCHARGWTQNPFTFRIDPALFVGYKEHLDRLASAIQEGHKIILLLGPTGSGKTTLLSKLKAVDHSDKLIYLPKLPSNLAEFVEIFNIAFPSRLFWKKIKSFHQIPAFLGKINHKIALLCDEAHEAPIEILEWIRVIGDQVSNLAVVISALPSFEDTLRNRLETLRKRASVRIEIFALSKEETKELIQKRILSVGGHDLGLFNNDVLEYVWQKSGGFPREVLRICDSLLVYAAKNNLDTIVVPEVKEEQKINLDNLSDKQKKILEMLIKPMSPVELAFTLKEYEDKQKAIRAINNILKRLFSQGFVERQKQNKTYVYNLAPRLQTIFVKA